jgi:hypothetical protein
MIQLLNAEQLSHAIERAKKSSLLVRPTSLRRQYKVINRLSGAEYYVNFFVINGKRYGECECLGAQNGYVCKHIACAAALNVAMASIRHAVRRSS